MVTSEINNFGLEKGAFWVRRSQMKVVVQNNHTVTVTTCQKTSHSAKYCAYHSNASQPSGAFATTDSFSQKQAVALATGTSVNQICSPQCSKCCTHHSLSSVVLTTAYQVLYSPQSTKCCTCHTLPSVVLATVYQVLYLPHSTKCCICHTLPSVVFPTVYQVLDSPVYQELYLPQPSVVFATVYHVLYSPQFTKRWTHQSTKSCICHSLASAVLATVYQVLLATNTSFNAALCLSQTLLSTIQPTVSLVMDTTFNWTCLPQEEMPHSTQCACHKKTPHLIQTSSSLVRGTSFNQAVHLSWAPHSIQCACHKKKHLTEPSGSPVMGTSFNPICLHQEKAPHSNKWFTCYGHLIQPNVPASKTNKTSFNQVIHLLWAPHSTQCACLKNTNKTSFNQPVHLLRAPHSIQCACLKKRHLIQTSGSLVMGTSFNPMCLPKKINKTSLNQAVHLLWAPHSIQCACLKKRHLIQTSSSLVMGTAFYLCLPKNNNNKNSFNQLVHFLQAPHSIQCACFQTKLQNPLIQPTGSLVMGTSFNPMCLPQTPPPLHSTKQFTCYGCLIQPNVPASKQIPHLIQPSGSLVTDVSFKQTPHSSVMPAKGGGKYTLTVSFTHLQPSATVIWENPWPVCIFLNSEMHIAPWEITFVWSFFCSTVFLCLKLALPPSLSHNYHLPPPSQSCSSPLSHPITLAVPKPTTTAVKRSSNPQRSALRSCEVKVSEPWLWVWGQQWLWRSVKVNVLSDGGDRSQRGWGWGWGGQWFNGRRAAWCSLHGFQQNSVLVSRLFWNTRER